MINYTQVIFLTRIVVFSDTHRQIKDCIKVLENLINIDMVIHLGDCVADAVELKRSFKDISFYFVSGNNDFFSDYPCDIVVEAEKMRLFCTHGHNYNTDRLVRVAKEKGCRIALRGHSHISEDTIIDNVRIINLGSISRPRDGAKSYAVIEIEEKQADACIIQIQSFN